MFYPLATFRCHVRCIPLCRWRASTGVMALGTGGNGDRLHLRGGRMRSARARLQDAKMMSFVLSGGGRRVDPPTAVNCREALSSQPHIRRACR